MQVIIKHNFETRKEEIVMIAKTKAKAQEYISKKVADKKHSIKDVYIVQQVNVYN